VSLWWITFTTKTYYRRGRSLSQPVANQAVLVIENAILYRNLEEVHQELKETQNLLIHREKMVAWENSPIPSLTRLKTRWSLLAGLPVVSFEPYPRMPRKNDIPKPS